MSNPNVEHSNAQPPDAGATSAVHRASKRWMVVAGVLIAVALATLVVVSPSIRLDDSADPVTPSPATSPGSTESADGNVGDPAPPATSPPETTVLDSAPTTSDGTSEEPATAAQSPSGAPSASLGEVAYLNDFKAASDLDRLHFEVHITGTEADALSFHGDHDSMCHGPDTTRALRETGGVDPSLPDSLVWYCAPKGPESGHFMTGMNTLHYNIISFAPISSGTSIVWPETMNEICWDQNITDLGGRKWATMAVVSEARFNANGQDLNYIDPGHKDNAGVAPDNAMIIAEDDFMYVGLKQSAEYFVGDARTFADFSIVEGFADKAARFQTCVRDNRDGTVTRAQARPDGTVDERTGPGSFPAGPRVFILQDVTYNAMKAFEEGDIQRVDDPFTWHWDNIAVAAT